jgi:hypothetical protein
METDRVVQIGKLEARLGKLGAKIETTTHEDRILLMHVERVAAHCKRTLAWVDERPRIISDEETSIVEGGSPEDPPSHGSSRTDTTASQKSFQPSPSIVTTSTPGSLSVLEARELFPCTPSPDDPEASPSSGSSSPSPRTRVVRKIAYAREQQVRAIMSDMKKRMKRGDP